MSEKPSAWKLVAATVSLLVLPLALPAGGAAAPPGTQDAVQRALDYLRSIQLPDGDIGYSYLVSAWVVMGLAAADVDPHDVRARSNLNSVVDYLRIHDAQLSGARTSATDWERVTLALVAAGEDPRVFAGTDHVAGLLAHWDGTQFGSPSAVNDDIFAILALRAAGFPADSIHVQGALGHVLAHQNPDGGWSYAVGSPSDADDTGAALMALATLGYQAETSSESSAAPPTSTEPPTCTRDAVDCALGYLDWAQRPDGGFAYHAFEDDVTVSNTASDAWVIQGLVAVGADPTGSRWTTETGADPVGHLLSLQQADGSFAWTGTSISGPAWMTAYALPALLGRPYPV